MQITLRQQLSILNISKWSYYDDDSIIMHSCVIISVQYHTKESELWKIYYFFYWSRIITEDY